MFKWRDSFSCNIKAIDDQHKKLFALGAKLNDLVSQQDDFDHYDEIVDILNELKEYTIYHFGYEEELMEKYHYEEVERHKKEHKAFINKITELLNKNIDEDQREVKMDMVIFIADWIEKHILHTDQKYKIYLNLKGVF